MLVGHFDADYTFARNGRNDAYAKCSKAQSNVVFEVFDFAYAYARGGYNFVERNGGAYGGLYAVDLDFVVL